MQRIVRALACAAIVLLAASCSHKADNPLLSQVPADTPYVFADLTPMDADVQDAILAPSNAQLPAQVMRLRHGADRLEADNPGMAGLLRAIADEFDGKTWQQIAAAAGIDRHGHVAIYGLGLAPVMRGELADAAKFQAFIQRLAKAYGRPFDKATLDGAPYRHLSLADTRLQVVVAHDDKQFMLGILPAGDDDARLRLALGIDKPRHNLRDAGVLRKLADSHGYQPQGLGYIDLRKLPALLAGGGNPMAQAMYDLTRASRNLPPRPLPALPASCKPDLARIAARVPMLSFGYTRLGTDEVSQRVDVQLAADIVDAFGGIKVPLPGLGSTLDAPFDLVLALPIDKIRGFWMAQADAVAARPFTCPALVDLNRGFGKLKALLRKAAVPPYGDLRGLRFSVDSFEGPTPVVSGRLLVASRNPAGLLAMAQAALPPLAQLDVAPNAEPVALPESLTAMFRQPGWIAMNDQALAIGIGAEQKDKLASMLGAPAIDAGTLMRAHVTGAMYARWLQVIGDRVAAATAASTAHADAADATRADVKASLAAARASAGKIDSATAQIHMTDTGVQFTTHTELH